MLTGAVGFNYNQGLTCWGCRKRRFQHQLHSLSNIIVWLEGRSWQPFMKSTSSNPLTFQELMLRLQSFWAERGCVLQQPYDVEVGAGTMTPETFLRVLGPRPYKVAYVQPSRRPASSPYASSTTRRVSRSPPASISRTMPVRPSPKDRRFGATCTATSSSTPTAGSRRA